MLYREQTFAPRAFHSELQQQTNTVNTQKSPPWACDKGCAEACAERFSALKPWPKSKTSVISKKRPSPLHHTFLLGRARFTAQPLSALVVTNVARARSITSRLVDNAYPERTLARMYYPLAVENKKFHFLSLFYVNIRRIKHMLDWDQFRFFCPLFEVKLLLLLREHKMYIIPSKRGSDILHWRSFFFVFGAFS